MARYCCYCGMSCFRADFVAEAAAPDDHLDFPISIATSVGEGGSNRSADVTTIQKALNHFPDSMGGASPKLTVNGIADRALTEAIEKFQRRQTGFVDGRVDPDKRTVTRINELAATVWVTVPDKTITDVYADIMPDALRCVLAADAALLSARLAFTRPGALSWTPPAVAMINRHFSLDKNPNAANDFELIKGLIRNMVALFHRNLGGAEKTFVAAPGRFSAARVNVSGVLALSFSGGINMHGSNKSHGQDGGDVDLPADKIMLMPKFRFASRDTQVITLIHELGHFLGAPDGSPDMIDDPPGGSSAPEVISQQPAQKRPRLAECYATFAFEAAFHRDPIRFVA